MCGRGSLIVVLHRSPPPALLPAPPLLLPRTYPKDYKPADEGPGEYQTIPLDKIEDFGVHAKSYYQLPITFFKSTTDRCGAVRCKRCARYSGVASGSRGCWLVGGTCMYRPAWPFQQSATNSPFPLTAHPHPLAAPPPPPPPRSYRPNPTPYPGPFAAAPVQRVAAFFGPVFSSSPTSPRLEQRLHAGTNLRPCISPRLHAGVFL